MNSSEATIGVANFLVSPSSRATSFTVEPNTENDSRSASPTLPNMTLPIWSESPYPSAASSRSALALAVGLDHPVRGLERRRERQLAGLARFLLVAPAREDGEETVAHEAQDLAAGVGHGPGGGVEEGVEVVDIVLAPELGHRS